VESNPKSGCEDCTGFVVPSPVSYTKDEPAVVTV
jgi:hypothetical protein